MKLILTESQDAIKLASYLRELQYRKKVHVYSKIAHETYTKSWAARRKNTNEGVMKGVPDFIIVGQYEVIFIELKRTKGGTVSPEQKQWVEHLNGKRTASKVCKGFLDAKLYIDKQLGVTIT